MHYFVAVWLIAAFIFIGPIGFAQDTYPANPGGVTNPETWYNDLTGGGMVPGPSSTATLRPYCPTPGNQGLTATGNAWALAHARTILAAEKAGMSGAEAVNTLGYEPLFIYNSLVETQDNCETPIELGEAVRFVRQQGVLPATSGTLTCTDKVTEAMITEAGEHTIAGFAVVFRERNDGVKDKLFRIKMALSQQRPVVMNFFTYFLPKDEQAASKYKPTFWMVEDKWVPSAAELNTNTSTPGGQHTMVIVGFDDTKYGGAFQVMNSFGTTWGNGGFCWISYEDFLKVANGGFELYPGQE